MMNKSVSSEQQQPLWGPTEQADGQLALQGYLLHEQVREHGRCDSESRRMCRKVLSSQLPGVR